MPIQKFRARDLIIKAREMDAVILRGELKRHESGSWTVDGKQVTEWLADLEGQQIYLIAVASEPGAESVDFKRTCRTCGRDYTGAECPHCREVRLRLRGR